MLPKARVEMKAAVFCSAVACALAVSAGVTVSQGAGGMASLAASGTEVLVAPGAPSATRFAAQEMTNFLSRVLGAAVPLATAPSDGKVSIVVGTNGWSRAAGVDPAALKRDGFVIKCVPAERRIYLAGCDDAKYDLVGAVAHYGPNSWKLPCECASTFAVYDFLERFAGVRFYFPGEIGTVVPRKAAIEVPAVELKSEPDWRCRVVFTGEFGEWPDALPKKEVWRRSRLEQLRLRAQTESFTCCHGQYYMNMAKRFGETHPEYFTMKPDGSRYNDPSGRSPGSAHGRQHLCQSSQVWDEIYEDAKSYFSGEGPERRGAISGFDGAAKVAWGQYAIGRRYYDVMPHDGHPKCSCPDCKAAYARAADPKNAATELVWGQTVRLARRIKEAGLDGTILQSSYADYAAIPQLDIPENVIVNVCRKGPWRLAEGEEALRKEIEGVRKWGEKVGGRLWLWVYVGKFACSNLKMPAVPMGTPHAMVRYIKEVAPYVMGIFPELGSERFIYHYFDLYLYSRLAWDNSCDADALMAEHYRLMYGAGSKAMERIFDMIESLWLTKVCRKTSPTPWGYTTDAPDEYQLFTEVYPPERLAQLKSLVAEALAAVPADSMEAKRIKYVSDRTLGPLAERAKSFPAKIDPGEELKWRKEHPGESLIRNGSFDSLEGWSGAHRAIDTDVFFSPPSSLRISSSDTTPVVKGGKNVYCRASALQRVTLKPGTRYRLSGFMKLKDVVAVSAAGGVDILVGALGCAYPDGENDPAGTRDWHRFAYEFKTPEKFKGSADSYIGPRLVLAYGTAWVDDLRLEEIK